VGTGESVCHPCAQSLIADSYPTGKRSSAVALYMAAVPFATFAGLLGGAYLAQYMSWRWAFILVGAPGILLALVTWLTIREPVRGQFDPPSAPDVPPYGAVLRHLFKRRTFVHLILGNSITIMASTGLSAFNAVFLARGGYGLALSEIGWILGLLAGGGMLLGLLSGGYLGDHLGRRDPRLYMIVPAVSLIIASPMSMLSFLQSDVRFFILFAAIYNVTILVYIGPTWATMGSLVEPRMRASAAATLSFFGGLIGAGVGPFLVGWFSDLGAVINFGSGFAEQCQAGAAADAACATASFVGLQGSMIIVSMAHLWAAAHYWRASKWLMGDLVAPLGGGRG
jgi:MFS family permease